MWWAREQEKHWMWSVIYTKFYPKIEITDNFSISTFKTVFVYSKAIDMKVVVACWWCLPLKTEQTVLFFVF